jgi:hypothetical protein
VIKATFIKAADGRPLSKSYNNKGEATAYPNVANFDSRNVPIPVSAAGLLAFEKELISAADKGECLLKGEALHQITNKRRAGLCDKDTKTQHVVIDIDGYQLTNIDVSKEKLTKRRVKELAELTIKEALPRYLHEVSYVFGVSSSFGIKPTMNIHFHFFLENPVVPKDLRMWLTSLNFTEELEGKLCLNKQKRSLRYLVDPATASNSQLIYIAAPKFHASQTNPLPSTHMRIQRVKKKLLTIDIESRLEEIDPEVVRYRVDKKIQQLQRAAGMPSTKNKYFNSVDDTGTPFRCVVNPPQMRIKFNYADDTYAHFDVNSGNSNGYWCYVNNPKIMHNFKGEEPFLFAAADPAAYDVFLRDFGEKLSTREKHMVVHDIERDCYVKVAYLQNTGEIMDLFTSKKESCDDWLISKGEAANDIVEPWIIEFNPELPSGINFDSRIINTFAETEYMRSNAQLPESITDGLTYGFGSRLAAICPMTHTIMQHALGGELVTYEHFINWLAYVFQTKSKAGTAWVLQGIQGTGKGLLFEGVFSPMFNHPRIGKFKPAAIEKAMSNFDDQFNGYMEHCVLMVVDEFRMGNSRNGDVENFFKNAITEAVQTIRGMRMNPVTKRTYTSFIFNTNEHDSVKIDPSDRRYNIGEYQRVRLRDVIPNLHSRNIMAELSEELMEFASFLLQFEVDLVQVRTPLLNAAKSRLREVSADSYQMLLIKFIEGDLEKFLEIIETTPATDIERLRHTAVRHTIMRWLLTANSHTKCNTTKSELRQVFEYFANRDLPRKTWNGMLMKANMDEIRARIDDGSRPLVLVNEWTLEEDIRLETLARHLSEVDVAHFTKKGFDLELVKETKLNALNTAI